MDAMVVSFHPLYKADLNILCAGREAGSEELCAIRRAQAVILPQGCPQQLYRMARENCAFVFPNYDARFRYPGKIGQIRLFREIDALHPPTEIFQNTADFHQRYPHDRYPSFPVVLKFDWGGEGDTVFLAQSPPDLEGLLVQARRCEASGQAGFILQQFVASLNRSLRVTLIGDHVHSYWRTHADEKIFHASLSKGARVDLTSHPDLRKKAEEGVARFSRRTGINLAGLDVLFAEDDPQQQPLFLEINYFFGRVGLGGSEAYYRILRRAIRKWLNRVLKNCAS
jgi:ribosomal protein S6--L-glutamate ligase